MRPSADLLSPRSLVLGVGDRRCGPLTILLVVPVLGLQYPGISPPLRKPSPEADSVKKMSYLLGVGIRNLLRNVVVALFRT